MEKKEQSGWVQWRRNLLAWFKKTIRIQTDTDYEATISSITSSIEFKGVNVWILFFAIIVASIGLNVNSTAVIIGAMLISPLMGPINGIGLAIGISDSELLKKSLTNLCIMVIISLIASFAYFLLSPLGDAQSELLARTRPTIFDVLIAFFGGAAGIIATSRRSQPFTVISGVAIATALMPPLCTAGYGLATAQFSYFLGAFYLFFINSFFIALSTYVIVRYLDFPKVKYLDSSKAKKVKQIISIFSIIVIIPSIIIAIQVIKESSFNSAANKFITEIQEQPYFEESQIVASKKEYGRKSQTITLSVIGKEISEENVALMQATMHKQYGLPKANLIVRQPNNTYDPIDESELIGNMLEKKDNLLAERNEKIKALEAELNKVSPSSEVNEQVAKEISIQYPQITAFSVSHLVYTNTKTFKADTLPTLFIKCNQSLDEEQKSKLIQWLRVRLNEPKLVISTVTTSSHREE